jgi:hypothetical protein
MGALLCSPWPATAAHASSQLEPRNAMVTLYLARFLGTEHTVALFPNRLQDRCEG